MLNFLSGYREPLHRLTTRGAWSTVLSLVLSAHLSSSASSSPLSTRGMLAATPATLASLAQITTHTEKDHPTMGPIVKVGEKDPEAFEILELLAGVLNQTGEILKKAGKKDLGEWVKDALVELDGEVGAMIVKVSTGAPSPCRAEAHLCAFLSSRLPSRHSATPIPSMTSVRDRTSSLRSATC